MQALLGQSVDPELVARVGADDRQGQLARQGAGAAGMVDVSVGVPDLLELQAFRAGRPSQGLAREIFNTVITNCSPP